MGPFQTLPNGQRSSCRLSSTRSAAANPPSHPATGAAPTNRRTPHPPPVGRGSPRHPRRNRHPRRRPAHHGGVNPALQSQIHPRHIPRIGMHRRIRPILGPLHEPVLDRVHPTIPDVRCVIRRVADVVLPEPGLPQPDLIDQHPRTTLRQRHGETRGSARSVLGTSTGRSAACGGPGLTPGPRYPRSDVIRHDARCAAPWLRRGEPRGRQGGVSPRHPPSPPGFRPFAA